MELVRISGYDLNYSLTTFGTRGKLLLQVPKILTAIKRERQWLDSFVKKRKTDIVISDCRFGMHHPDVYSVFITHQLHIRSPFAKWTESFLQRWNYRFIEKFNECWVPDFNGATNLAGELSHPVKLPNVPLKYIGGLSRFETSSGEQQQYEYDLLIILSGPEPQRTLLEKIMLKELKSHNSKAALVRGLPDGGESLQREELEVNSGNAKLSVYDHLPAAELGSLIKKSKMVISRSGYTTVMDLVRMKKKSIMIPTPGQSEQEYLGKYLMQQRICVCISQHKFSLTAALQKAESFNYADMNAFDMDQYRSIIFPHLYLPHK
ncbi:MAG TPA: glycosyltransferase [Chitinophagaceae bacterium]